LKEVKKHLEDSHYEIRRQRMLEYQLEEARKSPEERAREDGYQHGYDDGVDDGLDDYEAEHDGW